MRYHALACDYDGTLACGGAVDARTLGALDRLHASGRKLILITGRQLDDLLRVFPAISRFDRVVAENGAVLFRPESREESTLGDPPPKEFVAWLRRRGVQPLAVGRVIVATVQPNEAIVLDTIRDLGLELQVIFNKGAVMVLPTGINKATGLSAALKDLQLSPRNTVGMGDAENDHAFFRLCECSVAVSNALPIIKEHADLVTQGADGAGVVELIERLLRSDLEDVLPQVHRHDILLGTQPGDQALYLSPHGVRMLLCGTSGSGKSSLASGLLERLAEREYQFCIIDPEGDYQHFEPAIVAGDSKRPPTPDEVMRLLEKPEQNVVINLLAIPLHDRPALFEILFSRLLDLRRRTGRPHWIVLDETHHLLPASWAPSLSSLPEDLQGILLITVHPDHVSRAVLSWVDLIVAVGIAPAQTIATFSAALGAPSPPVPPQPAEAHEALAWWRRPVRDPFWFHSLPPRAEHRRHVRKYADGELGADKCFYFRGPDGKLNLRAQNLTVFLQLADGVDDETWTYHLRQSDYARWFRDAIKDEALAQAAEQIAHTQGLSANETRALIRARIEESYTAPA